jgi:twinkle protein
MKAAEYLDSMVIDDRAVDFDAYIHADEIAKVKGASQYQSQVKELFLLGDEQRGLKLPWSKASDFRFRDSELTIWTGYNGHKKSMLQGYVMIALLAQGGKGLIASLEMPPRKTLWRMCKQWTGNGDPTVPYVDKFFNFLNQKLWLYDQIGTVKAERMIGVARYAITELGVNHIVIDSLMKCGIGEDDYNKQKWFTDELSTLAKDTGAHIHLVAHSRKPTDGREGTASTKYSVSGSGNITNMADNVIVCFSNKDEARDYDQLFIIEKQRNGEAEPKYTLHFDDDSLQFKAWATAHKMRPEDWETQRWQ